MTTIGALFNRDWPVVDLDTITGGCALILAPHPDDESLGCGGLIAECCARGQPPLLVVLTDGTGSHPHSQAYPPLRLRALREAETVEAATCLGLHPDRIVFLRTRDTAAPTNGPDFAATAARLVALIRQYRCRSVLASWRYDPHCDHEAAALLATAVAHETAVAHWAYPVWARTALRDTEVGECTGVTLDVSRSRAAKRKAIQTHRSQWAGTITDDPTGFQMQPDFMTLFDTPFELFLTPS